jgi:hypothetical protein
MQDVGKVQRYSVINNHCAGCFLGIVMSGNEISQILLSLTLSYYGGQGNRPLWIAWGVAFSGLSCYILVLPHVVYGPGRNALALTEEYLDSHFYNATSENKGQYHTTQGSQIQLHILPGLLSLTVPIFPRTLS